jgi:hypothetical protein
MSTTLHAEGLVSIDSIIKQGLKVQMGELTGAGSRVSVQNLRGLVLPEGVLTTDQCSGIVVKKNTADPKISDIVKVKIQDQEINASEFVGFVIQ